ncbi:MAG: electron transport complex subunit RsxA [Spirochaetes bacterium GWF1_41_5]|nr:MAG: electron transport complex subunit RsxA [Spirochaetes bacterium GWF1_41_5]HBE04852.1 electron transport complex subunit RsxA [Spirochaetia bacterium]
MNYILILISAVLVNNFVMARFLGLCPFIGVSTKYSSSLGMGLAVIFVMTMSGSATWFLDRFILIPLNLGFLKTIVFILVIATLVQLVEMIIKKSAPLLYDALGIYLPLISTNCAVLGVTLINIDAGYSLLENIVHSAGGGIGFTLALIILSTIRERLEYAPIPECFKGAPIAFISAGLVSLAFLGFSGLPVK